MNINYCFTLKDVILYYENKNNKDLEFIVNHFILLAKFHIHKQTFLNSSPLLNLFFSDFDMYISSLRLLKKVCEMFRILWCTLQSPWCFVISLFLQIECELCFLFSFVLFVYNLYCYYLIVTFFCKKKDFTRLDFTRLASLPPIVVSFLATSGASLIRMFHGTGRANVQHGVKQNIRTEAY